MEFLGQARIGLVGLLRRSFEEAVRAGGLRVVTVESPAGWGKTRVVQELYGQLAMLQPRPAYWPRALDVTQRHRAFPDKPSIAAGARPAYFWWGWSCVRLTEEPDCAAAAANAQVADHLGGLAAAVAAGERLWRERLSYAITAATLLPALGVLHELADLVDKGADLNDVMTKARSMLRTRAGLVDEAFDRQGGRTIHVGDARAKSEVAQAADVLTAVSHLVPLVLAVDDAHDLDDSSSELLTTLRQRPLVGLIVATVRTRGDGEVAAGKFARWLAEEAGQHRVERHRLDRLETASLAKLAADALQQSSHLRTRARISPV